MAKYTQDDTYLDDERDTRRQSYLDQLDNQDATRATTEPVGTPQVAAGSSDSGTLPPSATPPTFPTSQVTPQASPVETSAPDSGPHGGTIYNTPDPYTQGFQDLYQQYLNRAPTSADFLAQSQNPGGLAGIQQSILTSPEYRILQNAPTTQATGTQTQQAASRTDANYIRQQVMQWMQSSNPQGHQDPEYWVQRILETGGLGPDNLQYWQGRFTEAPGTHQEGGGQVSPFPYQYQAGSGVVSPEIANYFKTLTDQINAQIAQNQQLMDARRQSLLQLMQQGQQPVDLQNDPILRGASDAYRVSRRSGEQQDRAALAERAAFTGLNPGGQGSGSFDAGIASLGENASRDIAGYDANLALNELNQRRQYLVQAIQIADAIGARNESSSLNATLAQIDAALKQQQLGYQYSSLGQQQNQFADSMAYNYAQLLQNANRDALLYG